MVAEDDQPEDHHGDSGPRHPWNGQNQARQENQESENNPHCLAHGADCSTRPTGPSYRGPKQTYYTKSNVKYQNPNSREKPFNTLTKPFRTYKFREVDVVEQRRSKRFDVKLPVRLIRNGLRSITGIGETKNLSSGGVLFNSDTRIDIGELQHHGTVGQGYVLEQFFATVPLPTFLRIVRANRVEGRLGQNEFTLQPEQLAALHELAGTIPHRSAR